MDRRVVNRNDLRSAAPMRTPVWAAPETGKIGPNLKVTSAFDPSLRELIGQPFRPTKLRDFTTSTGKNSLDYTSFPSDFLHSTIVQH
jgi:hypothetical protein